MLKHDNGTIAEICPIEDVQIKDHDFLNMKQKIDILQQRILNHPLHLSEDLEEKLKIVESKTKVSYICINSFYISISSNLKFVKDNKFMVNV